LASERSLARSRKDPVTGWGSLVERLEQSAWRLFDRKPQRADDSARRHPLRHLFLLTDCID